MGWLNVETRVDDTLQVLAMRHLGHAQKWPLIAELNNLKPPYLTLDRADGVLAFGDMILLPVRQPNAIAKPDDVFLTDIALDGDNLFTDDGNGGLDTVSGVDNLRQALGVRMMVPKRSLLFHPEYGCYAPTLVGQVNRLSLAGLAAFYVRSALLEDPRIKSVGKLAVTVEADTLVVETTVQPAYGEAVALVKAV